MISTGFSYIARPNARVLILGSLPGAESLRRGQYYALPRNAFWPIMGRVLNFDLQQTTYPARTKLLIANHMALWDVCAAAHRAGSLDSAIQSVVPNDFNSFFKLHPNIGLVCFNGLKAYSLFRNHVAPKLSSLPKLEYQVLPSTSPAHAAMSFEKKLGVWNAVLSRGLDSPSCKP